jgi:hypothetical protein
MALSISKLEGKDIERSHVRQLPLTYCKYCDIIANPYDSKPNILGVTHDDIWF